MFRIRRIFDDVPPADRDAVRQVQNILREQFPGIRAEDIDGLPDRLRDPLKHRFRSMLFAAESAPGSVRGFALLLHAPDAGLCYLDALASAKGWTSGGIGGALYQRVREEVVELGMGLLFEVLPDDPAGCPDEKVRRENARRIRFYERFGARVLDRNAYDTPIKPGDTCMPLLMYDDPVRAEPPPLAFVKRAVRAILERKYGYLVTEDYVNLVVESFSDDPAALRQPKIEARKPVATSRRPEERIVALAVCDGHEIHHVRDRGYVEAPARIATILSQIEGSDIFRRVGRRRYSDSRLTDVHDSAFVRYLRRACEALPPGKTVYPYVFPVRNPARPPKDLALRAGYYCIDTFTPLHANAYVAARTAVDCSLRAADAVLEGYRFSYALVRPPGHHAERALFGGFCYFNNCAVAAQYLSAHGRVAVLDIDYHHGNGTERIFYERADVLTVSIHGSPAFAYPYFSGFAEERGEGPGEGFNLNLPLPEKVDGAGYRAALARALQRVKEFSPAYLVVALGLDTGRGDPTGGWGLKPADFTENGRMIAGLGLPTVVVQEGGYRTRTLGANVLSFFGGLSG